MRRTKIVRCHVCLHLSDVEKQVMFEKLRFFSNVEAFNRQWMDVYIGWQAFIVQHWFCLNNDFTTSIALGQFFHLIFFAMF